LSLNDEDRNNLINYRIEKSRKSKFAAELLIKGGEYFSAINRIYYADFYILSALALKHNFSTSNHGKLIGWFNKEFIKNGILDKKYSFIIKRAFESRIDGDYTDMSEYTEDDTKKLYEEMNDLVNTIEKLIHK